MAKGYFNVDLTKEEISLARYICNYVSEKESSKKPGQVRLAKIIVHVVLKLNLPIRLVWYDMGLMPAVQPQIPSNYDLSAEMDLIGGMFDFTGLNNAIDEACGEFTPDLNVLQIRRKQYELLQDNLYLTKLDLEEAVMGMCLFDQKSGFLTLLSTMIVHIPDDSAYAEFRKLLGNYAVVSNSILNYCTNSREISSEIVNTLKSIFEYLDALNATYKKIEDFDHLFTSDTNPKDLEQRYFNARNSVVILEKKLSDSLPEESLSMDFDSLANEGLYSDFIGLLAE